MAERQQTAAAFGQAVKAARKERGWSQAELSKQAGVSRPTVARIENGQDGHTTIFDKVAAALDLTVSVRLLGEDRRNASAAAGLDR
jgi:transcriptional regulator with XRE-family HTH domain